MLALVPLVLVIWYLLKKGLGAFELELLHDRPERPLPRRPGRHQAARSSARSRWSGWPTLIAVPVGIGVALYLVEYGRESRFGAIVRYFVDVMTGVPSIVFGLFIYIMLV